MTTAIAPVTATAQLVCFSSVGDKLFQQADAAPGMTHLFGTLRGAAVSLWKRTSASGVFFSVNGSKKDETTGYAKQIGTANVRILKNGHPCLVVTPAGVGAKAIFMSLSNDLTQEQIVEMGLDLAKLEAARTAKPALTDEQMKEADRKAMGMARDRQRATSYRAGMGEDAYRHERGVTRSRRTSPGF